jgi:arylsulfatase A-like enzyme
MRKVTQFRANSLPQVLRLVYEFKQSMTSRAATGYREWITDYDRSMALYSALITGVDAAVGMIRDGLEKENLVENTVIIFTSDNGYSRGAHGFGDKVLPYEEASKSPLIIYDPRLPKEQAGTTRNAITGNIDMAPTILAIAGETVPDSIDGKNLVPLLTQPEAFVRDSLAIFNLWGTPSAYSMAIVTPEWKYIYWYWGEKMDPTEELFHLNDDRIEMKNLISDSSHENVLASLRNDYAAEFARLRANVNPGNGYAPFPVLFDPKVRWEEKKELVPKTNSEEPPKEKKGKKKKAA